MVGTRKNSGFNQGDNPDVLVMALVQLFQSMANSQFTTSRALQVGCTLEQFSFQHPPTFDGWSNTMDADNWKEQLE